MAVSTNKGYELIVTGTETDTWGDKLNNDVFNRIDENLGGLTTKSLTNVQVDLSAAESRTLRLVLSGTLTGNVLVTTLCIGMTIVENNCTGNFSVTFQKNGVGTAITLPNGTKNLVVTGASGDPGIIGLDFPAGTRMAFQQTTPPAGWTKDTVTANLNNSAMRIVTGSVANGGTEDFTTAFGSRTPSGSVDATTLSISQIPLHGHPFRLSGGGSADNDSGGIALELNTQTNYPAFTGTPAQTTGQQIGGTGGGQSHTHGLTMNAMNFAVRYFDFSIGTKA
jgi:hypothetical protein